MDSNDLDQKISNFIHRKELEFPGLSRLGVRRGRNEHYSEP